MQQPCFLPMTKKEMQALGWQELDILLVTGDAYVDHPSFGAALLGRHLVNQGFRTGIIAQPNWKQPESVLTMGRPRLYAGVTAGAMDSMVANYTANKKLRRNDSYTPGNDYGYRPNRASLIYTNLLKAAFPKLPIVLGGIEASMRRLAHYDYWEDKIRRSLLLDAKADILVYGMAEQQVITIAQRLSDGTTGSVGATGRSPLPQLFANIPGTAVVSSQLPEKNSFLQLPAYEAILKDKSKLIDAMHLLEKEHAIPGGPCLVQAHANRFVILQPPSALLSTKKMDALYALPFSRQTHPSYAQPVPALEPVVNSIVTHRGCFGGCTFCALGAHQGKLIQSRSQNAIIAEAKKITTMKSFHGTFTDLGGPSANMYGIICTRPGGPCNRPSCLIPEICKHLSTDHKKQTALLKAVKNIPNVKHAFVASGIRYDLANEDPAYIAYLLKNKHISGTLKIAPEHTSPSVLKRMRKPPAPVCEKFIRHYRQAAKKNAQPGYITAYFIASFPGSTREDMQTVNRFAQKHNLRVEQMQDFIPLPMTLAGIMYATGLDPWTRQPLMVAKNQRERNVQRKVLLKKNRFSQAINRPNKKKS
ncbi:YgiQ family radical SAM protein [bacterium]|nr:YgiQ family radical SAM protein [bacterium]